MTTPSPDPTDALDLLPTLLADSPRLRAQLEDRFSTLIDTVFDQLEETLEIGTPNDQMAAMKMILPLIVRVKRDNEVAGEDVESARAELQGVLAEMGEGLGKVDEITDIEEPEGVSI